MVQGIECVCLGGGQYFNPREDIWDTYKVRFMVWRQYKKQKINSKFDWYVFEENRDYGMQ